MEVRELSEPPNLLRLYAKAAATSWRGGGDELPDTEVVLADVEVDRDHLAAYDRLCGFAFRDELPATYPHLVAFPLAIDIMAAPEFPLPLPGLVHVTNRITQHRPLGSGERLTLRVRTERLRAHAKGRQLDVVAQAHADGELVWDETSTYLRRGGGDATAEREVDLEDVGADAEAVWRVPADAGRRYAAVSGDRNPIHLNRLTARLFGFPRPLAHGMWTKARCLAAFDGRLSDAFTVTTTFHKPLLLPGTAAFASEPHDGGWLFAVRSAGSGDAHLKGVVRPE